MQTNCSMNFRFENRCVASLIATQIQSSPPHLKCKAQQSLNSSPSRRRKLKLTKNLENPRRATVPTDHHSIAKTDEQNVVDDDNGDWSQAEMDAISSLFERKMPQKSTIRSKHRSLPLPLPYKNRPLQVPTTKHYASRASARLASSDEVRKNPESLIAIARDIADLPNDTDVSVVLDKCVLFLRKGSLSMTIRELGHMGLPERALQTLCWAQKKKLEGLFPDDRSLASAVEVLARFGQLKIDSEMQNYLGSASRTVMEAIARGFIRAGKLHRARKLLLFAKDNRRTMDASIHAKLILQAGKTPDGYKLASALLDELGERENLELMPQDCTAIMKICIRLSRFDSVEGLFSWYKETGKKPTVVMYTTVIYSRYCEKKYREGLLVVWEMEKSNCLLDLPAYRVIIRLLVALNDLSRATKYFSKLKDDGFSPTYDIYTDIIKVYAASGRLAKCKQVCKEVEMAGMKLEREMASMLSELESKVRL